jgi:hypothetical protein
MPRGKCAKGNGYIHGCHEKLDPPEKTHGKGRESD